MQSFKKLKTKLIVNNVIILIISCNKINIKMKPTLLALSIIDTVNDFDGIKVYIF